MMPCGQLWPGSTSLPRRLPPPHIQAVLADLHAARCSGDPRARCMRSARLPQQTQRGWARGPCNALIA